MKQTKYCTHCGKEILQEAVVCPYCGCSVAGCSAELDVPSTGLNILAFLIPIVGLILYLVYNDKTPKKAKTIGKWALIGFFVNLLLIAIEATL